MAENGFATFMDTERENNLWHKGIFVGIKLCFMTHDPRKLYKRLEVYDYSIREWKDYFHNDGHYHDAPATVLFSLIKMGEAAALYAMLAQPEIVINLISAV